MTSKLAWRSIWRNKRRTFITTGSITLGLTIAISFMAMGEGMYNHMVEQIVRMQSGHITLEDPKYRQAPGVDLYLSGVSELRAKLAGLDELENSKLIVAANGMARSGAGAVGVSITGVEPQSEARTSPLARNIIKGKYLQKDDKRQVVIGSELARRLKLKVGKKLVLTVNNAKSQLAEELCRVRGIFETGSLEVDGFVVQCPLNFARTLFELPPDSATQLGLVLKKPDAKGKVLQKVRKLLEGESAAAYSWQSIMPELANYIRIDRASNWVFQGLLVILVLFTIFNTILMSVLEREREFAVQMALGARPGQIMGQVLMESIFLGLIGCGAGMVLGTAASMLLNYWGFDMQALMSEKVTISGFAVSMVLRTKLTPFILWGATGLVFMSTILMTLVPLGRIPKIPMVDHLRQGV